MQTSKWGPPLNTGLMYVAAGYDLNDLPKRQKDEHYKAFFKSLGDVLPCRYCRESYKVFYESLDIQRYMDMPSCGMMRFVYDLRNMVNSKLIKQEEKALMEEYQKLLQTKSPDDPEFWRLMREKSHKICFTKPAPPFQQVVDELQQHKASCSSKMKTCRDPLSIAFPKTPDVSMLGLERSGPTDAELYKAGGRMKVKKTSVRKRKSLKKTAPKRKSYRKPSLRKR